jgi:hypothetical protein
MVIKKLNVGLIETSPPTKYMKIDLTLCITFLMPNVVR